MENGTKHDQEKPVFALIPHTAEEEVAKVFTYGAAKYGQYNWCGGIRYSRLYSGVRRHLNAFWRGEDLDPESGLPHLAHAAAGIMMLMETRLEHDDRPERELLRKVFMRQHEANR